MTFASVSSTEPSEPEKRSLAGTKTFNADDVDQFAVRAFAKKCEQFHEDPRPFGAFILNIGGELHTISLACSPTEETHLKKLTSKHYRDHIIHTHPLILARRGLIRFLIREVKKTESSQVSPVLMVNEDGELQLRRSCQLYMYSTYSYVCENVYWGLEAMKQWVCGLRSHL